MNNNYSALPEYSQEDLDRAHEEALAAAERIHKKLTSLAEDSGYVVRMVSGVKPKLDWIYAQAQNDPSVYPMVASGVDFLRGLTGELNKLEDLIDGFSTPFASTVNSQQPLQVPQMQVQPS